MAGGFTVSLINSVLDHVLGGGDYTRLATVYAALSTTTPTETGTNFTEPVGNNYSRVSITNNGTNFPSASSEAKSNGTAITFPTASGSWGTITYWGLYDASTNGNLIMFGSLTTSKAINADDVAEFAIGDLTVTMNQTA